MSLNNILLIASNEPVRRYAKAILSKISGVRLDPVKGTELTFVLQTSGDFCYENDVIEIYSEKEDRYFRQMNRKFIEEGYLKVYNGSMNEIPIDNIISDEDVQIVASIRTVAAMDKRLREFTSKVTLTRILNVAKEIGRPQSIINAIEERLAKV